MFHVMYCTMLLFDLFPSILFIPPSYKCGFLFSQTHSESRAITITTFAKDRVQELVSDTNSPLDEYVTGEETQYFTQVSLICETNVRMYMCMYTCTSKTEGSFCWLRLVLTLLFPIIHKVKL